MTGVGNLFSYTKNGDEIDLTINLSMANANYDFNSLNEITLGNTSQSIKFNLLNPSAYKIKTLSSHDGLNCSVASDGHGATLRLASNPDPSQPVQTMHWTMTLEEHLPGQDPKTVTIDPRVKADPNEADTPLVDILNG